MKSYDIAGYIDHTCLKQDATPADIEKLCFEAWEYGFASVCVNPVYVPFAKDLLDGSGVKVCTVIGFPLGANSTDTKVAETEKAYADGADEFDMVISVGKLKSGDHDYVRKDISAVVEAAKGKTVKVIIETAFLTDEEKIAACRLSSAAGAHFVKTCTGFSRVEGAPNKATAHDVSLMKNSVSPGVMVKASGGVRTLSDALEMISAGASRLGTSSGVKIILEAKNQQVKENSKMSKIVGPGSMIVDFSGYADHFPVPGETAVGSTLKVGPGGKGFNQMVAAHRSGANAVIIGCLGDDDLSAYHRNFLKSEGMCDKYVASTPDQGTGAAILEINEKTGQNRIIIFKGANNEVSASSVEAAEREFADAGAVLCQFETSIGSIKKAKELAKKYGKPFILNPAPFVDFGADFYDGVDYCTPNETEVECITGVRVETLADAKKAAEALIELGVKKAVITLGKNGSYYYDGKKEIHLPCLPMKAVDAVGAGDAFNGALAAAVASGLDDETALKFASAVSNLSVTKLGSANSMPTRDEIDAVLKEYYGISL